MDYQQLIFRSFCFFLLCAVLIVLSYFFLDARVTTWSLIYPLGIFRLFAYFSRVVDILNVLSVLAILYALWVKSYRSLMKIENVFFAASVSFMIGIGFKTLTKIVFARQSLWYAEHCTWYHHLSPYTFHWLKNEGLYQAFPSGHMTLSTAFLVVFWIAYPRVRWILMLILLGVAAGLFLNCYHFVSDVIAGDYLGSIVAVFTAYFFGLMDSQQNS